MLNLHVNVCVRMFPHQLELHCYSKCLMVTRHFFLNFKSVQQFVYRNFHNYFMNFMLADRLFHITVYLVVDHNGTQGKVT